MIIINIIYLKIKGTKRCFGISKVAGIEIAGEIEVAGIDTVGSLRNHDGDAEDNVD